MSIMVVCSHRSATATTRGIMIINSRPTTIKPARAALATATLLALAAALAGCGSSSAEGTYFGTAGDTALIINGDGTCLYTESYDEEDGVDLDEMSECTWTASKDQYTFAGISRSGTIVGTRSDDGSLSLPSQATWNGEIYTKE